MKQLFLHHLARLQQTVQQILESARLDGLWIYAGTAKYHFLDDQTAPFKINPHFNYFFPDPHAENSWLFLDGKNKPKIYYYAPDDYWHSSPNPPMLAFFADAFEWQLIQRFEQLSLAMGDLSHCAVICEDIELAKSLGFELINPKKVLNVLHFERSIKTEFEIECLYQAQLTALKGHQVAKQAFFEGKSEFEINLAYLQATAQSDNDVPYSNIIAINQHSAILHYTQREMKLPLDRRSFLIDAGTSYLGYASDLTCTYSCDPHNEFAWLIAKLEQFKVEIIEHLQVGFNYLSYHTQMHQWISQLLQEAEIVNLPADQIFEEGISRSFFPHGLGHLLGLQVHDVAGFQQNQRGTHKAPPAIYPSLRCTRDLQQGMVLTIEPGLYFIEMLLATWRTHSLKRFFNWQKIEYLKQFGGIRTEDNIVMRLQNAENLTAKAREFVQLNR